MAAKKRSELERIIKGVLEMAAAEDRLWPSLRRGGSNFKNTNRRGPFITQGHDSGLTSEDLRVLAKAARKAAKP